MVTFILINVFITLICEAFSVVKDDLSQQSNEYEIVDFVVDRFKMVTGLGEPKTKMPRRRRKVKEYNFDDYVEGNFFHILDTIHNFPIRGLHSIPKWGHH